MIERRAPKLIEDANRLSRFMSQIWWKCGIASRDFLCPRCAEVVTIIKPVGVNIDSICPNCKFVLFEGAYLQHGDGVWIYEDPGPIDLEVIVAMVEPLPTTDTWLRWSN